MTLKFAHAHTSDLSQPVLWDRLLNTTDEPTRLMVGLNPAEGPLHARRYLQAAVATCDLEIVADALRVFDRLAPVSACGARLSALATLHRYDEVCAYPAPHAPYTDPLELENLADGELARCIAHSEMGDRVQGLAHLHSGHLLASSLGMAYRAQWMQIERGRMLTVMGRPAPSQIQDALRSLPMSQRRDRWGRGALAEAYMAQGEYKKALQVLEGNPTPLWHFLASLLGDESSRVSMGAAVGPYADLARAIWSIRDHTTTSPLPAYDHLPERGYAQLLRARLMLTNPALRGQSMAAIGGINPANMTPDQRAMLAVMRLGAAAENADAVASQGAIPELTSALNALATLEYVLPVMQAGSPERVALAGLVPGAHPEMVLRLAELPLLTGEHVRYRNVEIKLPGKAAGGVSMVRAAFRGEQLQLHTETVRRTRNALATHNVRGELVNIGYLLRCLKRLKDAALPAVQGMWAASIENTLGMVDSRALRTDLARDLAGPLERRRNL